MDYVIVMFRKMARSVLQTLIAASLQSRNLLFNTQAIDPVTFFRYDNVNIV
jgi:hypothetical protein